MFVSVFVRCTVKSTQVKKIPKHQTLFPVILLALVATLAAGLPHPSKYKTFENDTTLSCSV
jgi:hypothetical protein